MDPLIIYCPHFHIVVPFSCSGSYYMLWPRFHVLFCFLILRPNTKIKMFHENEAKHEKKAET